MNCTHSQQNIILEIADAEFQSHLRECDECEHVYSGIQSALEILEEPVEVPDSLFAGIMAKKDLLVAEKRKSKDISLIFQVTTVLAAAVLLGIILGFHANTEVLLSKNQKKNEALIEFREIHHMNVDRQRIF